MNSLIENIYKTNAIEVADGQAICPFPSGIPYETGAALYQLIREKNLDRTLEIGMAYGLSTLFICQAHKDKGKGTHTAIDPNQTKTWKSLGIQNIKKSGLDNILRFFEAFSYQSLPQLLTAGENFDFAFIDGSHAFDYALVDFFYTDKLLTTDGYLVFDDLHLPSIRKLVSFVLRNRAYQRVKISAARNLTLVHCTAKVGGRVLQNPLEIDYSGFKFCADSICILQKIGEDKRKKRFYRSF